MIIIGRLKFHKILRRMFRFATIAGLVVLMFGSSCFCLEDGGPKVVPSAYGYPVPITCSIAVEGSTIVWKKDSKDIVVTPTDEKRPYDIFAANYTLRIIKVSPAMLGRYECVDVVTNKTEIFILNVKPFVVPFDKPKNVIQGDPLTILCGVWGVPVPTIRWFRGETQLIPEGSGGRITLKNGTYPGFPSIDNATLRIDAMDYPDSGIYMCIADSSLPSANATIKVEVKDKFAALWPFLGICAEVAILCAIILIYERRRTKRMEEEERQEEAAHLNANNDKKTPASDDVRHRK